MLSNLFKTTIRNFIKNKFYNTINVIGLTVGIACSIIIFMIVDFETSFDTYHKNSDNIYRIVTRSVLYGEEGYNSGVPALLPQTMKEEYSEFNAVAIVSENYGSAIVNFKNKKDKLQKFKEGDGTFAFVNSDYFRIFDFTWTEGESETAFANPYTAVLSESLARKYFADENPVGKIINFDYKYDLTVTGVIKDLPRNTDLNAELLININGLNPTMIYDNWYSVSTAVQCFVLLNENAIPKIVEQKFPDFIKKYTPNDIKDGKSKEFLLQKLSDMHYDNHYQNFGNRIITLNTIYALSIIGIFLILTACINFVNLSTAVAVGRSKEIGIRKVLGSSKGKIVLQYLMETFLITFLSLLISIVITEIALPRFSYFTGFEISSTSLTLLQYSSLYIGLLFTVTLLAGFYPSMVLSNYRPVSAIKSKFASGVGSKYSLRNVLVVFQFVISQFLIVTTIIISSQMNYFINADVGVGKDSIIEMEMPSNDQIKLQRFKNELTSVPNIVNVSYSNTGSIGEDTWSGNYTIKEGENINEGHAQIKFIDEEFLDTYKIKLLAGTNIVKGDSSNKYLVNETFADNAGYKDASELIGRYIKMWGVEAPVVGIIKDFNTSSLHNEIPSLVLTPRSDRYYMAAVKLNTASINETIGEIEKIYTDVFPESIMEYDFLDDIVRNFYENEIHTARIMNLFSFIAILIGCIGLFGLSSFASLKRTKEIGIRKVLGAGIIDIIKILNTDFIKLVFIGFVIASPIAFIIMNKWLQDFAFKIEISPVYFLIGVAITLFVALFTISFQSIKAALINPAETLKYE